MRNSIEGADPLRTIEPINVFSDEEPKEDPADFFDAASIWGANGNDVVTPSLIQCCRENPELSPYIIDASVAAETYSGGECLNGDCDNSTPDDVINGISGKIGVLHRPIPKHVVPNDHFINGSTDEDKVLIPGGDLDGVVKIGLRNPVRPGKKITKRPSKPKGKDFRKGIVS